MVLALGKVEYIKNIPSGFTSSAATHLLQRFSMNKSLENGGKLPVGNKVHGNSMPKQLLLRTIICLPINMK